LARSYGFDAGHDEFVTAWDDVTHALEAASKETLREFSMSDAARAFVDATGLRLTPGEIDRLGAHFVTEWAQHVRPIAGVPEMLGRLSGSCSVAIVSNTHDLNMVPEMLAAMGVRSAVSAVVLSIEHGRLKPHGSIYRSALHAVGCAAGEAVFVGDSHEADYLGPRRVGMRSFLIDPDRQQHVPDGDRLSTVLNLEHRLRLLLEAGADL
jgi:putative hydrolase of the HAD superfamily